jgi:hypothetical protein
MLDLLFILFLVLFFALTLLLVRGIERLKD